jgi:tight adherence protein C
MSGESWIGPSLAALSVAVSAGAVIAAGGNGILAGLMPPERARSWSIRRISPAAKLRPTGVAGPPAWFERRADRRYRAALDAQIPQLLDLLAAASSAGLSGQLALRRSVDALGGPLALELESVLDAVELGAPWRNELDAASERLGLPDLRRTVAALTRTETLGASLSDSTAELASAVRTARRMAVTERAHTAPVKMLFPLVFLVLPAFLLLTVVPVLLTTVQSIR